LKYIIYTILLSLFTNLATAQSGKDTSKYGPDSALLQMHALLLESENMRIRDSIRAAILHEELSTYKNPQKSQARELQAELEMVRNQDSLRTLQQKQAIEALRNNTSANPVRLFYDTLFKVYAPLGSFSAAQRAFNAQEHISKLYELPDFNPDSLTIKSQYGILNILYKSETITSISNIDGLWLNASDDSLSKAYRKEIVRSILYFKEQYSFKQIMVRVGYVAISIAVLLLTVWLINFLFGRIARWLVRRSRQFSAEIKVKNYRIFTPQRLMSVARQVLGILRWLVILLAIYFTLTFVFSIFPGTRGWANRLMGWVWEPLRNMALALVNYIPDLITIAVIIVVARLVARIFRFFSLEIERDILHIKGFHKEWAKPTYNIIRFLLYAFTFVVIFPYLPGSDSDAFKGVSVFLGILFSIGSSSAVSNTIAGLVITYMRPFKTGDWIKVNDVTGYVLEKNVLVTRLRTIHNEDITVPNSTILASHTINYSSASLQPGLLINTTVTIGYDIGWQKVHELLIQSAKETEGIIEDKPPFVFQKGLDDFYVSYEINAYTHTPERMYHIQSELHRHILDNFKAAGIEIMSPQQIHIKP